MPQDSGRNLGDAAFAEPWQAQLFALTVGLSEGGCFGWPEWVAAFSRGLERAAGGGAPVDGSQYYQVWLETLEDYLVERGLTSEQSLLSLKQAWSEAYLRTPHGKPVRLSHDRQR